MAAVRQPYLTSHLFICRCFQAAAAMHYSPVRRRRLRSSLLLCHHDLNISHEVELFIPSSTLEPAPVGLLFLPSMDVSFPPTETL